MTEPKRHLKLLVLSFYYTPDLSAGSFRATSLVHALAECLPSGWELDVVTTLPNRYSSFSVDVSSREQHGRVAVHRIALPAHRSGMLDQSRAFLAFARGARRIIGSTKYQYVFATSSRLMTAVLGSIISRRQRIPLYLDVRDIFRENIQEILPRAARALSQPLLSWIEHFAFSRASRINVVSEGFTPYFAARYPRIPLSVHTNGVDDEFAALAVAHASADGSPQPSSGASRRIRVLYAGNIGEGQGLHDILPRLATRTADHLDFRVIGDGGRKQQLQAALIANGVRNVELLPPVNRTALVSEYRDADVLFLHLNDYRAFERLLPSKVFEYGASGKPIWAGVAGYAATFIRQHIANAAVFPPCDEIAAEREFGALTLDIQPRTEFVSRFARSAISRAMAVEIVNGALGHAGHGSKRLMPGAAGESDNTKTP